MRGGGHLFHVGVTGGAGTRGVLCVSMGGHPHIRPLFGAAMAVEVEARHKRGLARAVP